MPLEEVEMLAQDSKTKRKSHLKRQFSVHNHRAQQSQHADIEEEDHGDEVVFRQSSLDANAVGQQSVPKEERSPYWWAGVTYRKSKTVSVGSASGLAPVGGCGGVGDSHLLAAPTFPQETVPNWRFVGNTYSDPDSVRPRRYLLNTMEDRPPDPKSDFSRNNSSELEFDYGAAISATCDEIAFFSENDSIFNATGVTMDSSLRGNFQESATNIQEGERTQSLAEPLDEPNLVVDEIKVLQEHLEKNREYYENLRRCYEIDHPHSVSPYPLERTTRSEDSGINPSGMRREHFHRERSDPTRSHSTLPGSPKSHEDTRRFSLDHRARQHRTDQSREHILKEQMLRRTFSALHIEEQSSLYESSFGSDDDIRTIASFPVKSSTSLTKMKKVLRKVIAFETALNQLKTRLLNRRDDESSLIQSVRLNPRESIPESLNTIATDVEPAKPMFRSASGYLKKGSIADTIDTSMESANGPPKSSVSGVSGLPSRIRAKEELWPKRDLPKYLPRMVRNSGPIKRTFHTTSFQFQLEKRLRESLKELENRIESSSDEDDDEIKRISIAHESDTPTLSPSMQSKCPSKVASPALAYRNLLNVNERFFQRINTSTCLVVPPEYRIPSTQAKKTEELAGSAPGARLPEMST